MEEKERILMEIENMELNDENVDKLLKLEIDEDAKIYIASKLCMEKIEILIDKNFFEIKTKIYIPQENI